MNLIGASQASSIACFEGCQARGTFRCGHGLAWVLSNPYNRNLGVALGNLFILALSVTVVLGSAV